MLLARIAKEIWGKPTAWAPFRPYGAVVGIDGKLIYDRAVMRRWVKGEWQYRAMTAVESENYWEREAW